MTKKEKKLQDEMFKRRDFSLVYAEFNGWLYKRGFAVKSSNTFADYHFSHYDKHITSYCGIEHYVQDDLKLSIRFIRDNNEHKIMFIGDLGSHTKVYSLQYAKKMIMTQFREIRDAQFERLQALKNF